MSGIAGILDLSGAPVDARLLRRMTGAMEYRGPDGLATWTDGPVGFGHALLRTTESVDERQPCSVDGSTWIAADARIDDRRTLVDALASAGRPNLSSAPDAHLILHAYAVWGEECVERLLGDFAFAIWDGRERRLFCARDRFGIKPFYCAHARGVFVFSNTLECVRLHPAIGDALNERAIGDFLLFGFNEDTATTTFAGVQRLPPAHSLTVRGGSTCSSRYWSLRTDGRIRYRRAGDYVEHFSSLLDAAVGDRLPRDRAGIWMSGGLDSTSIAAAAKAIRSARGWSHDFRAYSIVYDDFFEDGERVHAGVAAQALGLPIQFFEAGAYRPFQGWHPGDLQTPEPSADPFLLANADQMREASPHTRVLLCGDGGDETLRRTPLSTLLRTAAPGELAAGVVRSLFLYRQRPDGGVRSGLRRCMGRSFARPPYPAWLNRTFEDRWNLRERWDQLTAPAPGGHPLRPEAHQRLTAQHWPSYFESWDPGATRVPVEARFPFLDVRVVEYLMAIPPVPWCVNKQILRQSMRGRLPEAIRRRPKTPLAGDPLVAHLEAGAALDRFDAVPELARFVDRSAIPPFAGLDHDRAWLNVRPLCLNYWLKTKGRHGFEQPRGHEHDIEESAVREPAARRLR